MKIEDIRKFQLTASSTEKVYGAFVHKYLNLVKGKSRAHDLEIWLRYLDQIPELEHVRQFSTMAESVDYLLESINKGGDRFVIRDPEDRSNFILIEKDFAEKVLMLGCLP